MSEGSDSAAILDRLLALPKFGEGIGLHRVEALLACVPRPWLGVLDAIKITGSKGKGSVAASCESILRALDIEAGLFTSPHLLRFDERIRIAGRPISAAELDEHGAALLDARARYEAAHPGDRVAAFELFTALALRHFGARRLEAAVFEAGIGGRYDPTRLVPGSLVGLSSIEREHTHLLGETPELIAYDKADLCPSGGTLIIAALGPELERRLAAYARARRVELLRVDDEVRTSTPRFCDERMRFQLELRGHDLGEIVTPLLGVHQAANLALATALTWRWLERRTPAEIPTIERFGAALRRAAAQLCWPGRSQIVARDPTVMIDVGHTPGSARRAAHTVRALFPEAPILLVTGVSHDKDLEGVIAELAAVADEIVCTRAHHKGAEIEAVAAACETLRPGSVHARAATLEAAVDLARARARERQMIVWVAGGLFLAGEALAHLRGGDPRALHFV